MLNAIIHPQTNQLLSMHTANPSTGVVLYGPEGLGKTYVAKVLAAELLGLQDVQSLDSYPYWQHIAPAGNTIPIEAIRELQASLKLRLPHGQQRVIAITDAHSLSPEAQNALLKTLEEPPEATFIIMTAQSLESLLPTIRSRLQHIAVQPPSPQLIADYFNAQGISVPKQHISLANGRVGLLTALLQSDEHPLLAAIETAKQLVGGTTFDRLAQVDALVKQKTTVPLVLDALVLIFRSLIAANIQAGKTAAAQLNTQRLAATVAAQDQLSRSVQAKLVLDNLFLNL